MNPKSRSRDQQAPPRATSSFFRQPPDSAAAQDESVDGGQSWLVDEPAYDDGTDASDAGLEPDAELGDEYDAQPAAQMPTRATANRTGNSGATPAGSPLRVLGICLVLVGLAVGAATLLAPPAVAGALSVLSKLGVHAGTLVVLGLAMFGAGSAQVRVERRIAAAREAEVQDREWLASLLQNLPGGQSGASVDSSALHLEFQRLDEKITNLTRATKLYGTPLLEISNQVSDVASRLTETAEISAKLSQLQIAIENSERLEVKDLDPIARDLASTRDLAVEFGEQQRLMRDALDETQLAIVTSFRNGHDELRRAIADGSAHVQREVERQAALGASAPAVDLSSIEEVLTRLQREIQGLATSISRIESRPAPAIAPQTAMATAAPSAPTQSQASAPSAAMPADGLAERIAGTTQSKNKNVLGAIAKLRSMRG